MTPRRLIIGGNWKMNTNRASAATLARAVVETGSTHADQVDIVLCPPLPYLALVNDVIADSPIMLGAQNVWPGDDGAFTGEVSTAMLRDLNVQWVIVGHSERRQPAVGICEDDELINRKVVASLNAGLSVILCVGETLAQREAGDAASIVTGQLEAGLEGINRLENIVIAYEPVWAIGTGRTATPQDAAAMHEAIRASIRLGEERRYDNGSAEAVRIQYGGSVKPGNAADLFAMPDIDGGLIGGASLDADQFAAIVSAAAGVAESLR